MQHKLSKGPLLDDKGNLVEAGYSFSLDKEYDRKAIKGLKTRIKEWDYYYIGDENYGIALTIDDNSYMGLVSVSVLDYQNKTDVTKSLMNWLPFGETNFPSSSKNGNVFKGGKKYSMHFENKNGKRHLICSMKNVSKGKDFECDFVVAQAGKVIELVQVSYDISSPKTRRRELSGLIKAANKLRCNNLTLVTLDNQEDVEQDGFAIHIVSAANWLIP